MLNHITILKYYCKWQKLLLSFLDRFVNNNLESTKQFTPSLIFKVITLQTLYNWSLVRLTAENKLGDIFLFILVYIVLCYSSCNNYPS